MAFSMLALAAISVGQGLVSALSAEEERKANNDEIRAKQDYLRHQIQVKKRYFEVETYTKYLDEAAAGTNRLAKSIMMSGSYVEGAAENLSLIHI